MNSRKPSRLGSLAVLLFFLIPLAVRSEDTQIFSAEAYSIRIPADWQTEVTELMTGDDYTDLGFFWSEEGDGGLVLEAGMFSYPSLTGVSLTAGDDSFLSSWAAAMLEDFSENQPQIREFISADSRAFIVLDLEDELEPTCYAETLYDGTVYCFRFYAYRMADEYGNAPDATLTDAEYDVFRRILMSFRIR